MTLADNFTAFLRAPSRSASNDALSIELSQQGFELDGALFRAWSEKRDELALEQAPWQDARVSLGPLPPSVARTGDLWFDVCELMPMVFVGRSWLATRPVARWQMAGCLAVADWMSREVQVKPPYRALDPQRLLTGDETSPCVQLTEGEATLYGWWFGKLVPNLYDWRYAQKQLPPLALRELWKVSAKEWTSSRVDIDEAARVFVTPSTIDWDPDEIAEEELEVPEHRRGMIRGEYTRERDIGFRTAVLAQGGLLQRVSAWSLLPEDIRFVSLLDRSLFR